MKDTMTILETAPARSKVSQLNELADAYADLRTLNLALTVGAVNTGQHTHQPPAEAYRMRTRIDALLDDLGQSATVAELDQAHAGHRSPRERA